MAARCPLSAPWWPAPLTAKSPMGAVRRALVDARGPACNICGVDFGQFVDHDHLTGAVRGQLCRNCNGFVELCTHVSGCPYSDYLNAAPAAALGLVHPRHRERLRSRANRLRWERLAEVIDPEACATSCVGAPAMQ